MVLAFVKGCMHAIKSKMKITHTLRRKEDEILLELKRKILVF